MCDNFSRSFFVLFFFTFFFLCLGRVGLLEQSLSVRKKAWAWA